MRTKNVLWIIGIAVGALSAAAGGDVSKQVQVAPVVAGTAHQALFSVAFEGDAGVAVGAAGGILGSEDGGKTWKAVAPAPTELSLLGVDIKQSRAIAVGQSGLILTREQAGNWQKAVSGTDNRLFAVSLNSKGLAVAVGAFGTVLKSDDGGHKWKSVAPPWTAYADQGVEPHIYDVKVAEDGVATIVGEFGLILRSVDSGANWIAVHKGEASLFALDLRADGVGYAVGQNGAIFRTADRGATWAGVDAGSKANLLGVRSSPDGKVVVTAMRDMLASDDGRTWRQVSGGDFGTAWYTGLHLGSGASALVVGHSGRIVRIEQ